MRIKITKKQFLEAIENNHDGLPDYKLAEKLGITPTWFSQLRKKYKEEIVDLAKEITKKRAEKYIRDLEAQSRKEKDTGKTQATRILLELAGVYTPKQRTEYDIEIRRRLDKIREKAEKLADKVSDVNKC